MVCFENMRMTGKVFGEKQHLITMNWFQADRCDEFTYRRLSNLFRIFKPKVIKIRIRPKVSPKTWSNSSLKGESCASRDSCARLMVPTVNFLLLCCTIVNSIVFFDNNGDSFVHTTRKVGFKFHGVSDDCPRWSHHPNNCQYFLPCVKISSCWATNHPKGA